MIPTTDGSRAEALFARMNPQDAQALRAALVAAIAKAATLATEAAVMTDLQKGDAILDAEQHNINPIESTALDAAADVLAQHGQQRGDPNIGAAIAAGAIGAASAGASLGKVRGDMYRAGSLLGDVEAVASGNPEKIVRRGMQHVFWRAFGKAGRGIFRKIGGKR